MKNGVVDDVDEIRQGFPEVFEPPVAGCYYVEGGLVD